MSKLKYRPYRVREGRATLCLLLALAAALCGVFLTLATKKKTALPYAQTQLKAAERMAEAEPGRSMIMCAKTTSRLKRTT